MTADVVHKSPISYKVFHLVFWTIVTLIFIYDRRYLIQKFNLPEHFVACVVIRIGLLISLVYFHLKVLVPKFFQKRAYVKYLFLLLVSLLAYVSIQNGYDIYLYGFVIGDIHSRDFWSAFPYNFFTTLWYLALTTGLKLGLDRYDKAHISEDVMDNQVSVSGSGQDRQLLLKSGIRQVMVDLDTIIHIKGLKDYSIIYTDTDQIIVKGSLKSTELLLGEKKLIRVHKSYLVAVDRIKTIQSNQIILKNHVIPIGRSYKQELFRSLVSP